MVKTKTRVRRISMKLDDLLNGIRNKNKMKFVDAGDLVADIFRKNTKKKTIIENIRREIEF